MKATHLALVLIVLLFTAGCIGPPEDPLKGAGEARILVTSDMGTTILVDETLPITEDTTVLDLLQEATEVETAHDGGFVHSIGGVTSDQPDEKTDWFYHINGRLAATGSAHHPVFDQDVVVWDHRPWNHTMTLPYLLTGLPERPATTQMHDPTQLAGEADSAHIFLRVQGEDLQILDAWHRTARTVSPPWLAAHVIDDDGSPRLLLAASDQDAASLTTDLDDHPPTGLGVVLTPDTYHPIPAPEP